jgi:hypothetical protein
MTTNETPQIEGATDVVDWFGQWPSFHDAEVIEVHLKRKGRSFLRVWAFQATSVVDETGHYVCDRHAIVTFALEGVSDLELADFSPQNVISSLTVEVLPETVRLTMSPCFGVAGYLEASRVSVAVEPVESGGAT